MVWCRIAPYRGPVVDVFAVWTALSMALQFLGALFLAGALAEHVGAGSLGRGSGLVYRQFRGSFGSYSLGN